MMAALFLGRFQPPHRGHLFALKRAAASFDRVLVGVGSAQYSHRPDNPFTVGERVEMLVATLKAAGVVNVHLFPLPDIHRHAGWVRHVESLVSAFDVVVSNNPLTRRLFRAAGYRVVTAETWRPDMCSGRKIRAAWARGENAWALIPAAERPVLERIQGPDRVRELLMRTKHA